MPSPVTTTIKDGRYRLKQVLGEGGMATVYRAWDDSLGVWRAVKVLSPGMSMHSAMRSRFEAEARTMAAIRHPNVVEVYDVGQADGRAFFVMELMDGGSLEDYVRVGGRSLSPGQAVWAIDKVLDGLGAAHALGVVHRDIKPDNILLNIDGVPKLADFGIARVEDAQQKLTRTGSVLGTWAYMAPEQRTNAKGVDVRSDIYAVTATLFALLTGREPFDLYTSEVHDELFDSVPEVLRPIIEKGCRYKPEDRYADAAELRAALAELGAALPMEPIGALPRALPPEPELTEELPLRAEDTHEVEPPPPSVRPLQGPADEAPTGLTVAHEPPERSNALFWVAAIGVVLVVFGGIAWFARGSGGESEGGEEHVVSRSLPKDKPEPTQVILSSAEPDTPPNDEATTPEQLGEASGGTTGGRKPLSSPELSPWGTAKEPDRVEEPAPETPDAVEVGDGEMRQLVLRSWPPADVLINRVKVGRTPLTTEVGTRKTRVTLVSDKGVEKTETAIIGRGESWEWCWNFDQDTLCDR
ncbi:MAG: protein kinase [Alphaproteobacteria bacterium]|nr:protein kinase [Alphaproteobacteria bacterium]